VLGRAGWQEYAVLPAADVVPIEPGRFPPSYYLGVLGMPGMTAYFALLDLGKPKAGETVVVSAASGAVGQVVGQIAKLKGCRVIGIAGGPKKTAYIRDELGFDAAIDYRDKTTKELAAELAELAPDGVHVYFDNVGGLVHDAAMLTLAVHARIIICGVISIYDQLESIDFGPRWMRKLLIKRARMEGFLVTDYADRRGEFLTEMTRWLDEGRIKYREDVTEGLAGAPAAFIGLLAGRNNGKTLVRVSGPAAP
jgi:NADPH-dependent curcumin reductase CurA